MADQQKEQGLSLKNLESEVKTDDKTATLPPSTPAELRRLAEDLPEKDAVQKAYKAAMTATDHQVEAKNKAKVVDESPDAGETPSGVALKKVAGISNDTERGEEYARIRAGVRHGYILPEDA
jgi:hypothetical protein